MLFTKAYPDIKEKVLEIKEILNHSNCTLAKHMNVTATSIASFLKSNFVIKYSKVGEDWYNRCLKYITDYEAKATILKDDTKYVRSYDGTLIPITQTSLDEEGSIDWKQIDKRIKQSARSIVEAYNPRAYTGLSKIIKMRLRNGTYKPIGVILAEKVTDNTVAIGMSICRLGVDKFDKEKGYVLASNKARNADKEYKFKNYILECYNDGGWCDIEKDLQDEVKHFIDRCLRFYRDKYIIYPKFFIHR